MKQSKQFLRFLLWDIYFSNAYAKDEKKLLKTPEETNKQRKSSKKQRQKEYTIF